MIVAAPTAGRRQPPDWAARLVEDFCAEAGRPEPVLTWRQSASRHRATGTTSISENRIVVTAGSDRADTRMILLHELAHHLTGEGHTKRFWEVAVYLFLREAVYTAARRSGRAPGAASAYRRLRRAWGSPVTDLPLTQILEGTRL